MLTNSGEGGGGRLCWTGCEQAQYRCHKAVVVVFSCQKKKWRSQIGVWCWDSFQNPNESTWHWPTAIITSLLSLTPSTSTRISLASGRDIDFALFDESWRGPGKKSVLLDGLLNHWLNKDAIKRLCHAGNCYQSETSCCSDLKSCQQTGVLDAQVRHCLWGSCSR